MGGRKWSAALRVILAAGTMSTLRLLFAGSSEPGGLNPMPSFGRTFGGNGDFIGAWFENLAQPPMFETVPVLGRFKVDGQDVPFTGMWALAGIDTVPLVPGWKRNWRRQLHSLGWERTRERRRQGTRRGA